VANKADKIPVTKLDEHILQVTKSLFAKERIVPFSAENKLNLDLIKEQIESLTE
jgi:GTP-binding protein EngB required for normal cell division